jgi:type I restriction enzyme M protein
MGNAIDDVPQELKSWFKVFNRLCNRWDYVQVFDDFLCIWMNWFCNGEMMEERDQRMKQYSPEEKQIFNELFKELVLVMDKQTFDGGWYDPFGEIYQAISSSHKSSAMGQFFTPETLCNLIAHSIIGTDKRTELLIGEPACGSGRLVLAAHTVNRMNHYVCTDADRMCAWMTAVNMCLHNMSGAIMHANSLTMEFWSGWIIKRVELAGNILPSMHKATEEEIKIWHNERLLVSNFINRNYDKTEEVQVQQSQSISENSATILHSISTMELEVSDNDTIQQTFEEEIKRKTKKHLKINPDQLSLFD